ncbi:PAS domain S-box protein [Bacillus sp. HMF5848]|uniref:ATP-binding protein n=1 Tax=Bacillus sp. HMF5848 TaxID=2495421 RepID=UPI000F765DE8|nr:ATP-binding protein [Bacillus sp. HMF5848]RSK26223.1 PAS domain S-box protein [Bacillus sp. HMF5848]
MFKDSSILDSKISIKEALEISPFPVLIGKGGFFLYANRHALSLLETDNVEQVIGKNVIELTHESSIFETKNFLEDLKQHKQYDNSAKKIVTFKHNILEIESVVTRITLFDEEIDVVFIKDHSQIKEMEQKYLIQQNHYQTLIDNSIDTVALITADHIFKYINKSGLKLLGAKERKEIIGKSLFDFVPKQYHDDMLYRTNHVIQNQCIGSAKEREMIRIDGSSRHVESVVMPFYIDNNPSLQVIIRDITEQKQNLKHIIQSEKLLTAGQLSAGIAHEIRNPLTSIKGFLQFMENKIPQENQMYTQIMMDEIDKIERITGEMLSLSKPQAYQYSKHNLVILIREVITLLNPQAILKNVEFSIDFKVTQFDFNCDKQQIKQVFINVIKNAIEAMEHGGLVSIVTEASEKGLNIHITDQGQGIPKDTLTKVSDPFFTTKGTGTGLGLTICNAIIKDYEGEIVINSKEQEGTTVTVVLPANTNV